jgi:hypothetical protein
MQQHNVSGAGTLSADYRTRCNALSATQGGGGMFATQGAGMF